MHRFERGLEIAAAELRELTPDGASQHPAGRIPRIGQRRRADLAEDRVHGDGSFAPHAERGLLLLVARPDPPVAFAFRPQPRPRIDAVRSIRVAQVDAESVPGIQAAVGGEDLVADTQRFAPNPAREPQRLLLRGHPAAERDLKPVRGQMHQELEVTRPRPLASEKPHLLVVAVVGRGLAVQVRE